MKSGALSILFEKVLQVFEALRVQFLNLGLKLSRSAPCRTIAPKAKHKLSALKRIAFYLR